MAGVNPIGLDIGSMSIRAVQTARTKDGPVVTGSGIVPLPEGAVQAGVINDDKAVTTALKQLWSAAKFHTRSVVLGVTHPQVVVREMSVTNLPAREMHQALPFQVRDALPLPVERALLDFYPLEDPGTNKLVHGLVIAVPKEAVLTAVRAIERAKLHVARVDLASFALLRAASRLDSQVEAIVDIGAAMTSVVIHADGEPLIVRTIPRGGAQVTQAIAERLHIPLPDAEAVKCRIGLRPDIDPQAAEAVREAVWPLVNEIRSSFAYLTAGERQSRVSRLALSGGGCLMPGLPETLATQLAVQVVYADPLLRIRDARRGGHDILDQFRPSAAISVGLTLGAAR